MIRYFLQKKKLLPAAMSAALVATAFQPAGCTINIDENLLRLIQGIAADVANGPDGGMMRPPFPHPPYGGAGQPDDGGSDDAGDSQEQTP